MKLTILLSLLFISNILADVLFLSENEFAKELDGSHHLLVEFFAPWCGHCKSLAPEYKLAGEAFKSGDGVKLIAIDATEAPKLSADYKVTGYPTIKYFPKGSNNPEDYNGGRTADDIIKFLNGKAGTSRKIKTAPSDVITLTSDNFDSVVLGSKHVLVEFYAPWCGHCKSLAPTYEQLASVYAGEKDVVIAKIDASDESTIATKYGITGFPTIKYFPPNTPEPIAYEKNRELEDFVNFINENAGTERHIDGTLFDTAGRVSAVDTILSAVSTINTSTIESIKALLDVHSSKEKNYIKTYITIAEKIIAKGADYVSTETKRLEQMISNPNVTADSKTNFLLKLNILKAFIK